MWDKQKAKEAINMLGYNTSRAWARILEREERENAIMTANAAFAFSWVNYTGMPFESLGTSHPPTSSLSFLILQCGQDSLVEW